MKQYYYTCPYTYDKNTADTKCQPFFFQTTKIRCPKCGKLFEYKQMQIDHIIPHKLGGRTTLENAQFMCSICNPSKGAN